MNLATIEKIKDELESSLAGKRFGKIFPLSRVEVAIDLRLQDSLYLFISVEPGNPRIYLVRRRLRDLEKASGNPSPFVLQLRKHLASSTVTGLEQIPGERVLTISFSGENELGQTQTNSLVAQLTGNSANLFLLDENGAILETLRRTNGDGQEIGMIYSPPQRPQSSEARRDDPFSSEGFATLSEALDAENQRKQEEREFRSIANTARSKINGEIRKREKLVKELDSDLAKHGDADRWKKYGDLLLANIATATRNGSHVEVTDYFDEAQATIEIDADENDSISEAAENYFRRYTKARNAREEIQKRKKVLETEFARLVSERDLIEKAVEDKDVDRLVEYTPGTSKPPLDKPKKKEPAASAVARIFRSSEGYEILVGKRAKDNDHLTFRVAKSLDTWMHAADYPGSHVVVRNPDRKDIPQRTLLEAAQLAAFYSQGKAQPKAAVHYTQKKFVNKPKGAAPGLVSLASFKTLLVEPVVPDGVEKKE